MTAHVFVPRLVDAAQLNPQNNNARMLLSRWSLRHCSVTTLAYDAADSRVASHPGVRVVRLWRGRAWRAHLFLRYLRSYDALFYPGVTAEDSAGIRWRRRLGRRVPMIATLEGLLGDAERERFYATAAGHPVYCQRVPPHALARSDAIFAAADHVIAISPFLARMGRARYGDKFSVLPLGIDTDVFRPAATSRGQAALTVVAAGRVSLHKRPGVFLELARRFPEILFRWYGEGDLRESLITEAASKGLGNLAFPGSLGPTALAAAFRAADAFVLPSHAEGVPKVTQEAAACGLPVIAFGFYESPSVEHGRTGYVVWSDEELEQRLVELLGDDGLRTGMSQAGSASARALDWDLVAPQWERAICGWIGPGGTAEPEQQ